MSTANFEFILPTHIKYGDGVSQNLGAEAENLGASRICVITDKGLIDAGIVEQVLRGLSRRQRDDALIFDQVEPNPRDTTVQRAAEAAREKGSDLLVAVGGGSSMDVAKAVAVLLTNGGTVQDYEGLDKVSEVKTPIIAIPTTVGTGSEVTFWSVITDTKRRFKMSVGTTKIAPKIALVDPRLVANLPASIVASTGMDALTHAIEGYTCLLSEPITDAVGIYAIRMIAENLEKAALRNDGDAKANMLLASLLAGISFGNSDIAAVHAMAEALGGMYDTPHGIANAILLPYVMAYNCDADTKKFAEIARAMGEDVAGLTEAEAARKSAEAVKRLSEALRIPSLRDIQANPDDFRTLAAKSAVNVSSDSNVKKIDEEGYFRLFQEAYDAR